MTIILEELLENGSNGIKGRQGISKAMVTKERVQCW
jgi:hypothetical protein